MSLLGTAPMQLLLAFGATIAVPKDHKAIQAAIDAARPGDEVVVSPGTYRETLRVKAGVLVRSGGDGAKGKVGLRRAEATIVDACGRDATPGVTLAEGATLDGFTVTGVGRFDQKEYDKHHATRGEDLPDGRGAVGAGKNIAAVEIAGVSATVRHCIVRDNGHAGIGLSGKGNRSRAVGNIVCRNMGGGIGVADGATPVVEGNVCFNNLRAGIGVRAAAGLILRNECRDNVRAGIGIREGATPLVRHNVCHGNRRAGIGIRMKGTSPAVEENDCRANGMAGIGCRDAATPTIRRNRCHGNTLAGIGVADGAGPRILGNHVHDNKLAGIGFDACEAGEALVVGNRVLDNGLVALGVNAGWKVRAAENVLTRKGGLPPLVMVAKGAALEITGTTLTGSGVAGVRVEGKARIVGNTFECPDLRKGGPPQHAVWGLAGAEIEFVDNTVKGWRHGLSADKAAVTAVGNTVSGYWQAGIRITGPSAPAVITGNVFRPDADHPGVVVPAGGFVEGNRVEKSTRK